MLITRKVISSHHVFLTSDDDPVKYIPLGTAVGRSIIVIFLL